MANEKIRSTSVIGQCSHSVKDLLVAHVLDPWKRHHILTKNLADHRAIGNCLSANPSEQVI
jgi:hypothetical protein